MQARNGVSVVELLIVIFMVAVLASVGMLMLFNSKKRADIDSEISKIKSLLAEAQSKSVSQSEGGAWGVHFENATSSPFYSLFLSAYSSSTNRGTYSLPAALEFSSSSLAVGASREIMFKEISGYASSTFSLVVKTRQPPITSITLNVSSTGAISSY